MSECVPARLVKGVKLADVPVREYAELPPPQERKRSAGLLAALLRRGKSPEPEMPPQPKRLSKTQITFNSAAWLKFLRRPDQPVSLYLVFRDDSGEYGVLVDETRVSETFNAMLSGTVTFTVRGHLHYVSAVAAGVRDASEFHAEEVYVQRKRKVIQHITAQSA